MSDHSLKPVYIPRRGRPDARQIAAIDRAILSTARSMFLEEGYDATAMEAIASGAGVSKATLYARYSAKGDLFRAVIEDRIAQWSLLSERQPVKDETLRERLLQHGLHIARALPMPEVYAFQKLLISTREQFPELSLAMYENGSRPMIRRIADDIVEAAREDDIAVRDPEMIARLFLSAMVGWQFQEGSARSMHESELMQVAQRIVDLFLLARAGW